MTAAPEVAVVRTGLANLASVLAGLRRAGAVPSVTEEPAAVERAPYVILPGVGAFGAAMKHLHAHGLVDVLRRRLDAGRPTACVCLGLQLLCESSEEDPGVEGLGHVPASIQRLPNTVRVPQLGWNSVEPELGCEFLTPGHAYFANSFSLRTKPAGWHVAWTEHGVRFVAAMEKGDLLACQFHPELSGNWGLALVKRWVGTATGEECGC